VALLSACSGSHTDGTGRRPKKTDLPADHYDAAIYLCVRGPQLPGCHGAASRAQTDAVRTQLGTDSEVVEFLYLSQQDSYRVAQASLPSNQVALIKPGELPAAFLVVLSGQGDGVAALKTRFGHAAGVEQVTACRSATKQCSVAFLRKLHVVH
jgi:FtsX-like permease family protein